MSRRRLTLNSVIAAILLTFVSGQTVAFAENVKNELKIVALESALQNPSDLNQMIQVIDQNVSNNVEALVQVNEQLNQEDSFAIETETRAERRFERKRARWLRRLTRYEPQILERLTQAAEFQQSGNLEEQVHSLIPVLAKDIASSGGILPYIFQQKQKLQEELSGAQTSSFKRPHQNRQIASVHSIGSTGCFLLGLLTLVMAVVLAGLLGPVLGMIVAIPLGLFGMLQIVFSPACNI